MFRIHTDPPVYKPLRAFLLVRLAAMACFLVPVTQGALADTHHLPLLPSAADPSRHGMVRIVNHSAVAGEVRITAIDDSARYFGPVTLTMEAHAAIQISSEDLEQGSETLGIIAGTGRGEGDWRLVLESDLDIEPLAYAQTPAGFIDSLHDVVPRRSFYHRVDLAAPNGIHSQGGTLRLSNLGQTAAEVVVFGLDDEGGPAFGRPVVVKLPAGTSRSINALDLEVGAVGLDGRLGSGDGDWRLLIFSDGEIGVMTLMENPSGPLANLSTAGSSDGGTMLFPAAVEPLREGLLRIASRAEPGDVALHAVDEAGTRFGPVTLSLEAGGTTTLDSYDLEAGSVAKGLPKGLGRGEGDWRLRFETDLDLDIFAYARTPDGFLTAIHDVASTSDRRHHVPLFTSASETRPASQLRLSNPGEEPAEIRIQAWDDAGDAAPNGAARLSLPAGETRTISADMLEQGAEDLDGSLGKGTGNWRLSVQADRDIRVMSLLASTEGHLTNLSTTSIYPRFLNACVGGSMDKDGDGITDHCDADPLNALRPLGACANGTYIDFPELYPGLVNDCRVLIGFANYQAQSDELPEEHGLRKWGFGSSRSIDAWEGISVSLFGRRVTEIRIIGSKRSTLQSEYPTGSIPSNLGSLTELTVLDLSAGHLSGPIPPELGQLSRLTHLYLGNNQLSGPIPPELGQLSQLTHLSLSVNQLSGPIPPELGQLSRLTHLYLGNNQLSGPIPPELGQLSQLTHLSLSVNQLSGPIPPELGQLEKLESLWGIGDLLGTGTIPWALWERYKGGQLNLNYEGIRRSASIQGVSPPPQSSRPVFSVNPDDNGNAAHHSVSYYQGPLMWEWNWKDRAVEHQRPVLGRWAALAVTVDHETPTPPVVATRLLDSTNAVLVERLSEAAAPVTNSVGAAKWRTEYVFDLPGDLYQAGNQVVHIIDPDNDLAESDENDNVGPPIRLYGEQTPRFRVTFVPIHVMGVEPPSVDPRTLMAGTWAYLPIRDDYQARLGAPLVSDTADRSELLNEVLALWNAEADPDEFYHGVGSRNLGGGRAVTGGRVGVSAISPPDIIPHEIGHNFGLLHTPGCSAGLVDPAYPYPNGALGSVRGWDVNWRQFVSKGDEGNVDVMSYCGNNKYISDYNYEKALNYWVDQAPDQDAIASPPLTQTLNAPQGGTGSSGPLGAGSGAVAAAQDALGGLALSGRVRSTGEWSLTHAQRTDREPRPPAPDAEFTLILFDGDAEEIYREPLSVIPYSEGGEAGWAARTPIPQRPAREVVIEDAAGNEVLRQELPVLE